MTYYIYNENGEYGKECILSDGTRAEWIEDLDGIREYVIWYDHALPENVYWDDQRI